MSCLPDDLFKIMTTYTFGLPISQKQLLEDIERVMILRECIDDEFLCVCSFDGHLKTHISNPYRSFGPYYYTKVVDKTSIFGNAMICLCHCLDKVFFDRIKSYRLIFLKYSRAFQLGNIEYFNKLLTKYLIYIQTDDILHLRHSQRVQLIHSLDFCSPVPVKFL